MISFAVGGQDLLKCIKDDLQKLRWERFSIVFQISMNVLNPVMKIKDQIYDAIWYCAGEYNSCLEERARKLFEYVNVSLDCLNTYPHQLNGGRCKRIGIARALSVKPKLILADKPTFMLHESLDRSERERKGFLPFHYPRSCRGALYFRSCRSVLPALRTVARTHRVRCVLCLRIRKVFWR